MALRLRRATLALIAVSALAMAKQNPVAQPERPTPRETPDQVVARLIREGTLPGVIYESQNLTSLNHQVIAAGLRTVGQTAVLSANELYPVASITKVLTSLLVLQEIERGKLNFDTPLKDLVDFEVHSDFQEVTVQDIMVHRGGFPDEGLTPQELGFTGKTRAELLKFFLQRKAFVPVGIEHYSTYGFAMLGALLEDIEKKSWETLVYYRLLIPLQLVSCRYTPGDDSTIESGLPILSDAQLKAMMSGHYSDTDPPKWTPIPVEDIALDPLLNPGAGLYCNSGDVIRFVSAQTEGYRDYLASLQPSAVPVISKQQIFRNLSTFGWLFRSPLKNSQTVSHWTIYEQDPQSGQINHACAFGALAGTAVITCFDLPSTQILSAFTNAWDDQAFNSLSEILDAGATKACLKPARRPNLEEWKSFTAPLIDATKRRFPQFFRKNPLLPSSSRSKPSGSEP